MQQGLLAEIGYGLAVTATTVLAVTQPFVLVPVVGHYLLLVVPVIVAIVLRRAYSSREPRARILALATAGAALALGTDLIVRNLPPFTVFEIPTPNIFAPAFQLDGEAAEDAGMYELWCVVWLAMGLLIAFAWVGIRATTAPIRRRRAG